MRRLLVDTTPLRVSSDFRRLWLGQAVSFFGTMITTAAGNSDHPDYSLDRHEELTRQVLKWTESFYSRQGSSG